MGTAATSAELVGREAELAACGEWLGSLGSGSSALLVAGEAGIGKTSVWAAAVAGAADVGHTVCTSRPVEAELPLAYAALGDLLPDGGRGLLVQPLADTLVSALGLEGHSTRAVDPLRVGRATLAALRALAARGPLVVAVDDVQWLDPASARALAFALRRLGDEPVGLLAALRDGHDEPLHLREAFGERVVELRLDGLSVGATGRLLRSRLGPELSRRAVLRAHEGSGGNPLFALELARVAREGSLPASLRDLVERRLGALEPSAVPAVELSAVRGPAPVGAFDDLASLDAAVRAGVLVEQAGEIRFAHPLLAAGAYARLPPGRRRSLHGRAAATAASLEERARHLALSCVDPDPGAAALLDEAAQAARVRGAPESAAELAAQSRRLTPSGDREDWARRTIDEADHLLLADDEAGALALVDEMLASEVRGTARVRALGHRALFQQQPEAAVGCLEEAVREPHDDRRLAALALAQLAWQRGCWLGDVEPAAAEAANAVELAETADDESTLAQALTTAGLVGGLAGDPRSEAWFRRALAFGDSVELPAGRNARVAFAHDLGRRGHFSEAAALLDAQEAVSRRVGDEWLLLRLNHFRSELELRRGRWDEAERLLDAALVESRDYWWTTALVRRALLRGRRGDPAARADADEVTATPLAAGDAVVAAMAEHARGLLELAGGQAETAVSRLTALTAVVDRCGARVSEVEPAFPEAVLALAESGRPAEADVLAAQLERRTASRQNDLWGPPAAALCRGLVLLAVGESGAALERLQAATAGFTAVGAPWEQALALLAEGNALRRAGRRTDAGSALERAAALFAQLRADPWRQRAEQELRRARPRPRRDDSLTPAESRVAALVAAGRTNKEVAAALFTSVATVEAHLTRIYRKLGVRSRSELTRAVGDGSVALELDGRL